MNEGIIKFNIKEWGKTNELSRKLWDEIEKSRKKLYKLGLIGFDKKNNIGYGNISKRLKKLEKSFIITGSQTGHLQDLNGSYYSIIKEVDFNKNSVICNGPKTPSSESITHAACYFANNNIQAVIHIHCLFLWEMLIKNDFLSTPAKAEYGSIQLSKSIKKIMGNINIEDPVTVVMKGHKEGIIIAGRSLPQIIDTIIQLYNSYKIEAVIDKEK